MNDTDQKELSFVKVLRFFARWRYPLIIITVLAAVAGYIFSGPFFITPLYESQAKFYVATSYTPSYALLERTELLREDMLEYGEEDEAEKVLQILQSDQVMLTMKEEYNLMDRFGIEPGGEMSMVHFEDMYSARFSFDRSPFASVVVTTMDQDPEVAAEMANSLKHLADTLQNEIKSNRADDAYRIVEQEYESKKEEVTSLIDSLKATLADNPPQNQEASVENPEAFMSLLQQFASTREEQGILQDMLQQQGIAQNISYGNPIQPASTIPDKDQPSPLDDGWLLHNYGPEFYALSNRLALEVESLSYLKERKEHARVDAEEHLSNIYPVEEGRAKDKEAHPVRLLYVIGSLIAGFLITIILLVIYENLRQVRQFIKES